MHLILAFLGTVVTILILVNRLSDAGLDIGWLNPFTWRRRRAWRNKLEGNPVFSLSEPLEVAALLSTAVAKLDGEISREEKAALLELFKHEFNRTDEEAADLLRSSTYLFGDGDEVTAKPDKIPTVPIPILAIKKRTPLNAAAHKAGITSNANSKYIPVSFTVIGIKIAKIR